MSHKKLKGYCAVGKCELVMGHKGMHSDKLKVKTEDSEVPYKGVRVSELIRLLTDYKKAYGDHLIFYMSYGAGTFDLRHREELE